MRSTTWMMLPAAAGLALAGPLVWALDEVTGGRVVDPSADRVMEGVCAQLKSAPMSSVRTTRATAFYRARSFLYDQYVVAKPPTGTSYPTSLTHTKRRPSAAPRARSSGPPTTDRTTKGDGVVYVVTIV